MGTRADFYIGRGKDAEWLGSIAWDGHSESIAKALRKAKTPEAFRNALADFFCGRDDVTLPADGWPWPWDDSHTTDYAYAFDGGKVYGSCFGSEWFDPLKEQPDELPDHVAVFPDMCAKRTTAAPGSKRSGVMVFGWRR